jgi:hypothetical protein
MRWMAPHDGQERLVRRFLWLPVVVAGEWRWLERATLRQRYSESCGWFSLGYVDETKENEVPKPTSVI